MARLIVIIFSGLLLLSPAQAQEEMHGLPPRAAPTSHIDIGTLPVVDTTPKFDAARATTAYLSRVGGAARARSDAYFEGGYWLMLVDLLWALAVAGILLWLGISAWLRNFIAARSQSRWIQTLFYAAAYVVLTTAATLPLTGFELVQDQVLTPSSGLHGVRVVYDYELGNDVLHTFDQTALVNNDGSKIYLLIIRCSASCYRERSSELDAIAKSFTVRSD